MINKVSKKDINLFVREYNSGVSIYKIAKNTKFTPATIKKWIIINGIELRKTPFDFSKNKTRKPTNEKLLIELYVKEGKELSHVCQKLKISRSLAKYYLEKNRIKLREKGPNKTKFTDKEKKEIIRLYTIEKRGAKYIGSIFNRSDTCMTYWLNKWGVKKNTRSEISLKIRKVYGPTKGFTGKRHTKSSKKQISESGLKAWDENDRLPIIGKSRTFNTKIGKVLGSYEVAYIQKLTNEGKILPKPNRKKIKTPFGQYVPDFDTDKNYIEIKSPFTLSVCKGKTSNGKGKLTDIQWKKIQWVRKNIKSVKVIVIKKQDALNLFKQAIKEGLVLDKVEIKNSQYKIL